MPSIRTPQERSLAARAAAYSKWSTHDAREGTAKARAAFNQRFFDQVDPDGLLPETERQRRAEADQACSLHPSGPCLCSCASQKKWG